jgi:2,5-diketo-D-gluconate reductase A
MTSEPRLKLNDGHSMPQLGFGVWQVPDDAVAGVVRQAIGAGYRLIDTAAAYGSEAAVGKGISDSGLPRSDVFVTTKLANRWHGFDNALRQFEASQKRLNLDHVDLFLIHWPCPAAGLYVDTWRAIVRLKEEGRVRSIGVSNFNAEHLRRLIDETGIAPAVNQIELHPRFQQKDMRRFDQEHGIATQSWSPLGQSQPAVSATLAEIGAKYGKSWAQVAIRWHVQNGLALVSRTVTPERLRENRSIFDFELDDADLARIAELDDPEGRVGPLPEQVKFDIRQLALKRAKNLLKTALRLGGPARSA